MTDTNVSKNPDVDPKARPIRKGRLASVGKYRPVRVFLRLLRFLRFLTLAGCLEVLETAPPGSSAVDQQSTADPSDGMKDLAVNPSATGLPSPLGSDGGWGGGAQPWEIVDGHRDYVDWFHGLAFTGGHIDGWNSGGWLAPCGPRQATIDLGAPKPVQKVVIWHHGDGSNHVPAVTTIDTWDASTSSWTAVSTRRVYGAYFAPGGANSGYSYSDEYFFPDPVKTTKVRYSFDNCGATINGSPLVHGWLYAFEVYGKGCGNVMRGSDIVINGTRLAGSRDPWVRYVAASIVPQLPGDRSRRIETAARTTWWSLKEGVLGLAGPAAIGFSLCDRVVLGGKPTPTRLGPLETCDPKQAWQVGLAGAQVHNFSIARIQTYLAVLWPLRSVADVLGEAAKGAGYDVASEPGASIVASTTDLQQSWLLRNPTVGFGLQETRVTAECINASLPWCYGGNWTDARNFAPDRDAAFQSIEDLECALDALAP